jgi:hypothetical protein
MKTREPQVENHGIFAEHDQCCAVYWAESAVLGLSRGIFEPSWKAQQDGWQLVRARTKFQRWLVRTFLRTGVES